MRLSTYLKRFTSPQRAHFALAVGTTLGHLNNVAYDMRLASAALTRQIARHTNREVAEWELRPTDWALIWPELIGTDGAPPVEIDVAGPSATEMIVGTPEATHAAG